MPSNLLAKLKKNKYTVESCKLGSQTLLQSLQTSVEGAVNIDAADEQYCFEHVQQLFTRNRLLFLVYILKTNYFEIN